jgi:hypothetical protein
MQRFVDLAVGIPPAKPGAVTVLAWLIVAPES